MDYCSDFDSEEEDWETTPERHPNGHIQGVVYVPNYLDISNPETQEFPRQYLHPIMMYPEMNWTDQDTTRLIMLTEGPNRAHIDQTLNLYNPLLQFGFHQLLAYTYLYHIINVLHVAFHQPYLLQNPFIHHLIDVAHQHVDGALVVPPRAVVGVIAVLEVNV